MLNGLKLAQMHGNRISGNISLSLSSDLSNKSSFISDCGAPSGKHSAVIVALPIYLCAYKPSCFSKFTRNLLNVLNVQCAAIALVTVIRKMTVN